MRVYFITLLMTLTTLGVWAAADDSHSNILIYGPEKPIETQQGPSLEELKKLSISCVKEMDEMSTKEHSFERGDIDSLKIFFIGSRRDLKKSERNELMRGAVENLANTFVMPPGGKILFAHNNEIAKEKCKMSGAIGFYDTEDKNIYVCALDRSTGSTLAHEVLHAWQYSQNADRANKINQCFHFNALSKQEATFPGTIWTPSPDLLDYFSKMDAVMMKKYTNGSEPYIKASQEFSIGALVSYCTETQAFLAERIRFAFIYHRAVKAGLSNECLSLLNDKGQGAVNLNQYSDLISNNDFKTLHDKILAGIQKTVQPGYAEIFTGSKDGFKNFNPSMCQLSQTDYRKHPTLKSDAEKIDQLIKSGQ